MKLCQTSDSIGIMVFNYFAARVLSAVVTLTGVAVGVVLVVFLGFIGLGLVVVFVGLVFAGWVLTMWDGRKKSVSDADDGGAV